MSKHKQHRRGRVIFLVLSIFVVIDQLLLVLVALVQNTFDLNLFWAVLRPVAVIYCTITLWQGENWLRWIAASWCMLHGVVSLIIFGFIMTQMAKVTPPEQTGFFLHISAVLFGLPLLQAVFYFGTGLTLAFSPSLKAFLNRQAANPNSDLVSGGTARE